jgi:predicted acylesterase/phospholipase RssA
LSTAFRAPTMHRRRALVKHVEPAEAPIELCEENDELDEAPSPPPRRRNRIRRKLRRSTIGGVVGALGPWPTVPWTSLGILLPWTPLFDTLSLVLLFLRSARVDLMERRFREEASTYIKSTVETDEPPLRILCMDGGGVRGANLLSTLDALDQRIEGPLHEAFDVVCGTSIGGAGALLMAHTEDPLEQCRKAMSDMADAVFAKASGWRLLVRGQMTGRSVLTEVVTERIGASQDLRAPVVEPPPPPPKTKKRRRVRRFLARVVLRRKSEEQPAPKIMGRKPLAFAVAAREAETGSLEPFLFRTYPREQGTAPGRSDVKLWQAVAATCAAPAVFAPVQIDGESYVDGGVVANDPTLLALAEVASVFPGRPVGVVVSLGCGQTKRERRAERREERRWFRRRSKKKPREELSGTERWFRRVGLTWDHEPRIRRRARLALQRRKAQYFRVEPPLASAVSLSETDTSKLESMDANVKEWLTSPVVAGRLDEIGRSLERRRVIKEEEEIRYPITTNVFRTLNAARRGVGAGVNTLLGDAPQRFRRKTRNVVVDSSRRVVGALTDAGDDVAWALLAPPSPGLEEAVEGEGREWTALSD